jgi:hypothetical protein
VNVYPSCKTVRDSSYQELLWKLPFLGSKAPPWQTEYSIPPSAIGPRATASLNRRNLLRKSAPRLLRSPVPLTLRGVHIESHLSYGEHPKRRTPDCRVLSIWKNVLGSGDAVLMSIVCWNWFCGSLEESGRVVAKSVCSTLPMLDLSMVSQVGTLHSVDSKSSDNIIIAAKSSRAPLERTADHFLTK